MRKIYLLICVFIASVLLVSCGVPQSDVPTTTLTPVYTTRQWTPFYNGHSCGINMTWLDTERASQRDLSKEEILTVLPGKRPEGVTYSGRADFREDGSVLRVFLWIKKENTEVFVVMGDKASYYACCVSREPEAVACSCGEVEYKLYQNQKHHKLFADTVCGGVPMLILTSAKLIKIQHETIETLEREDIEQHRPLFEDVLECFSWFGENEPNLNSIKPTVSE